jgi:tetratricopeptide (TPR) repeat protein
LRLDPSLAPALNNRADVFRRAGRLDAAQRDYAAALKCPGASKEYAYYGLGQIARQRGDARTAGAYFQRALAANPDFMLAAEGLTEVLPKTESGLRPSQDDGGVLPAAAEMPAVKPETAMAEPSGARTVLVQLGAFQTEASAHIAWDKTAAASGDALHGLTAISVPVDSAGKPRLWRLRTSVASRRAAESLCSALTRRQLACVLVRH